MKPLPRVQDAGDLKGKRVLVRADFNVPVDGGIVIDTTRVTRSLETIKFLQEAGAKVGIVSHIESDAKTLQPIVKFLSTLMPVHFATGLQSFAKAFNDIDATQIAVLENVRNFSGEKENDEAFAKQLAATADIYVNDAFSVSHREHTSVVGLPKHMPHYAGFLFQHEYEALSRVLTPTHPFLFILGGAKFETKVPLIKKFLTVADYVFVGGALANNFFRAKGYEIGISKVSDGNYDELSLLSNQKLLLPVDVVTADKAGNTRTVSPLDVRADEWIADNGPATVEMLVKHATDAQLVVWNGPLGAYETGFKQNTLDLAAGIAELDGRVTTILGGGDTVAAIKELNNEDTFTFVSTAGGAMLEFLEKGTLPGIQALQN